MFFALKAGIRAYADPQSVKFVRMVSAWAVKRKPGAKALVICRDVRRAEALRLVPGRTNAECQG